MADKATVKRLDKACLNIKLDLLRLCNQTGIHIGGDLSSVDAMTAIWQYAMKYDPKDPEWEGRDRFVLSKGHAAAVTSFCQAAIGCYDKEDIYKEYATNFGRFGMHSCNLLNPYVEVSTGSLGHGFPVAGGIATALKIKGSKSRVFTVLGDGECAEGSIWEAAMAAAKHKLGNFIAFVDRNRMSYDGDTEKFMPLGDLGAKFAAFGWRVCDLKDGNDMEEIIDTIDALPAPDSDVPTVVILNTVKGHSVDFMENSRGWHSGRVNDEDYAHAVEQVRAFYTRKWGED